MSTFISGERRAGDVRLTTKKGQLIVEETYHYFVTSTDKLATRLDILQTVGLPVPNSITNGISPSGLGLCTGTNCERVEDNPYLWEVTANFSSNVEDNSGSNGNPNSDPTTWVPIRETILEPYEEVLIKDKDDKPFMNGARVPYANAPATPKDNIRWDFFQFEPDSVTDETIADRNNTLNSLAYKGRAKHTLLLKIRRSIIGTYYGASRRLTEYSLVWKKSNWHDKTANYGDSFLYNGKRYAYRHKEDPDTIIPGPLGTQDYTITDTMDARGGLPTGDGTAGTAGAIEEVGGDVFAKHPTQDQLYFIERRVFDDLAFADFLRI